MNEANPAGQVVRRASLLSVVLPVFDEALVLRELTERISRACEAASGGYEIILVNDGSTDDSAAIIDELATQNPSVRALHLSRNFGHQAAVQAGLGAARGDAVVLMDSDMQDTPEAIGAFVEQWQQGWDVVYAIRAQRKEGVLKRGLFSLFYTILCRIADVRMPLDAGNFGLIDRRVRDIIVGLEERDRYYPGLRAWVGFRQKGIVVERQARYDNNPRVKLQGLFKLAKTAVFSFSTFPLRFFSFVALLSMVVCLFLCAFTLYHKLFTGLAIPGWTSYIITVSLFGALNALGISVLGEYVIRIYDQVRARPGYVVARTTNCDEPPA